MDKRIEICRKKIALIRSFIEQLYDYWFVQFKFSGYECSNMEWNDKVKKNIPQHWTVGVLSDFADIAMGQSPEGTSYNTDVNGLLFFQEATDFGEFFPSERQYTTSPTRYAKVGDILLSVRAPVGAMNIAMKDCCIGRGLAAIRGKDCCNSFIEITLKKFATVFARKNGDGTTFGAITKDELFGLPGTEMRSLRWGNDADLRKKERSALSLLPLLQRLQKGRCSMPDTPTSCRRN